MLFGEMEYKCFIVDDNLTDRLTTVSFIREYSFLKIEGIFDGATTAIEAAEKSIPDVVFLDIDMPDINGLALRVHLDKVKVCIFITAYPDYALPAIELNALDFLIKPLNAERFETSMMRLKYYLDIQHKAELFDHSSAGDSLFIKDGHSKIKLQLADIMYLEALKDYTGIITKDKKYCILTSLGKLLEEKFFRHFIRIHRSYAVPMHKIQEMTSNEIIIQEKTLPVGRSYKDALKKLLNP